MMRDLMTHSNVVDGGDTEEGDRALRGVTQGGFPGEGRSCRKTTPFFPESWYCLGASQVQGGGEGIGKLFS